MRQLPSHVCWSATLTIQQIPIELHAVAEGHVAYHEDHISLLLFFSCRFTSLHFCWRQRLTGDWKLLTQTKRWESRFPVWYGL